MNWYKQKIKRVTTGLTTAVALTLSIGHGISAHATSVPLPDLTPIVEKVERSVVAIRATRPLHPGQKANEDMYSGLRRHFGSPGQPEFPALTAFGGKRPPPESIDYKGGAGTGFFVSQEGHIITNAHVVEKAVDVVIRTSDGREFFARVVGSDERSDIALLKIEASNTPPLAMGRSEDLKKGEWVIAMGTPYELDFSLAVGVISNPLRFVNDTKPFIQSNLSINPGNSGGPLMNMKGEVVGVNSNLVAPGAVSAGISLSIPIADALNVASQLKASGRVTRGHIGAKMGEVTPGMAAAIGLNGPIRGAMVAKVISNGPADRAGIEAGDIIIKVGSQPITTWSQVVSAVGNTKPGNSINVEIWRKGKTQSAKVTVDEAAEPVAVASK